MVSRKRCCGCISKFKRFFFFLYAFSLFTNFATSVSFLATLYNYPGKENLDDKGKKDLMVTQILSTIGLGIDTFTQIWIVFNAGFHCCSIIIAWVTALMPGKKWKVLNDQRGEWPVFKLKIWTNVTHNFLLLAATIFFFRVLQQIAPTGTKISTFFKIVSLCFSLFIFFCIELPMKCCMHKTGKEIGRTTDKIKDKFSKKDKSKGDTKGGDEKEVELEVKAESP